MDALRSRLSLALGVSLIGSLVLFPGAARAQFVYFDGSTSADFRVASNWDPDSTPGTNLDDFYGIDDGLSSTLNSGETITIQGLRVGSAAKGHPNVETQFGRLTVTDATLEVVGSNTFAVGRERQNERIGADYDKDSFVDGSDFLIWQRTLGSSSDLSADGDNSGTIDAPDLALWKAGFGKVLKGGEVLLNGASILRANGALIGERTSGRVSIGSAAIVDIRIWDTTVTPNQFGGTEDLRIGGYGPAYETFGGEPGLDGRGLIDVQGQLTAKDLYLSEHGAVGEIRVTGEGSVNLNGGVIMSLCAGCVPNSGADNMALLAQQASKISLVGSSGTFIVGLDPDPLVLDPAPANRDMWTNFPSSSTLSFQADTGGVTPIVLADNGAELSGTAMIAGMNLEVNLDAYAGTTPLVLIDAKAGLLSGTFGKVTFLGHKTATVNYDVANGNVFLNNFQLSKPAGETATSSVPEPTALAWPVGLGMFLAARCTRERTSK